MSDNSLYKSLEGITVAKTHLNTIDGEKGKLTIGGFPLEELALSATFEETVYLLQTGELPTREELQELRTKLNRYRSLSDSTLKVLREAPNKKHQG